MNSRRFLVLLLTTTLLWGCAPAGVSDKTEPLTSPAEKTSPTDEQQLREALAALPGAEVSEEDAFRVLFPAGSLFAQSALLPMPGGAGMLDTLTTLIRQSGRSWQIRVRANTGEGEAYDRRLAEARVELLRTYMRESGIDQRKIRFESSIDAGTPMELKLLEERRSSSGR